MGAGTPATALLTEHGVSFTLHEYELEPLSGVDQHRGERIAYGDAAAAALGISPDRLYKTLVLAIEGAKDARLLFALAVVPSSGELSEKGVAAALGIRTLPRHQRQRRIRRFLTICRQRRSRSVLMVYRSRCCQTPAFALAAWW